MRLSWVGISVNANPIMSNLNFAMDQTPALLPRGIGSINDRAIMFPELAAIPSCDPIKLNQLWANGTQS